MADSPLLEVIELKTHFPLRQGIVRAVDGVNFTIPRGQAVGLVGESGCGKSMTARTILRITPPSALLSGKILYRQRDSVGRMLRRWT